MGAAACYELVELLGTGGMGHVYRAVHRPSGRPVAVKMLHAHVRNDPLHRRLFLDEATAAAKVDDPRIVRLLDLGRDAEDAPFLVMELADGPSLEQMIARWDGWDRIATALLSTLEGLSAAHAAQIVHRDLKPANVLVDPVSGLARVLDFGVAALVDPLRSWGGDDVVGTPEYMPPEQLLGQGPYGPWTDLYAFGVILSSVVWGRSPFADQASLTSLLVAKANYDPASRGEARAGLTVPDELHALVQRLLRPHPRERPRFAVEVHRELAALVPLVVDAVRPSPGAADGDAEDVEEAEHASASGPTSVDLGPESEVRARSPMVAPESSGGLELPVELPAPDDLSFGAALARLRETPMVGREAERAELEGMVRDVVEGGGARLVAYVGEAGIGKSRLARWGMAYAERTGTMEPAAGGYDASGADVAGGLRHALRRLVGLPTEGWADAWTWFANESELDPEALRSFLRARDDSAGLGADAVAQLAHATMRAVGRRRPIYLWLDDVVWARDGALDLVEQLLEAQDVPVLLVATIREDALRTPHVRERIERLLAHDKARRRTLGQLGFDDRLALLESCAPLDEEVARQLAARVEGSPLMLVQLVEDAIERGVLVTEGSKVTTRAAAGVESLLGERPLASLVEQRIDAVLEGFGERAMAALGVLGRAALLGTRFEHVTLANTCARDHRLKEVLDAVLDRALLVGVLRSERGEVYAFDHGLVREALLERVEHMPRRVSAYVDAANGLQARYGKERPDIAALVADFLYRAGDRDRAWERQLRAIERAAWAGDIFAAESYLTVARRWADDEPERLGQLEHAEARVCYFALRYEEAIEHATLAKQHAEAIGDEGLMMACDATIADQLFFQDRLAEAQQMARRCYESGADEDPEQLHARGRAAQRLAELSVLRGDLEEAVRWHRRTVEMNLAGGWPWRARIARLNVAETLAASGHMDEATEIVEAVKKEAKRERDEDSTTAAREAQARIDVLSGRPERAVAFLDERWAQVARTRDGFRLTGVLAYRALAAAALEDDASLAHRVRELVAAFEEVPHDEAITSAAIRALAVRLEERGKFELARRVDRLLEARQERFRAGFEGG